MTVRRVLFLVLVGSLGACDGNGPGIIEPPVVAPPVDLSLPLERTSPGEAGFNASALDAAFVAADEVERLQALAVARNGRVVREEYFEGNRADSLNDIRSATKSVVSTLVGAAIHRGLISDTEATLGDLLEPETGTLDADEAAVSLRDLLTMTGGWEWDESTAAGYNDWVTAEDQVAYLLERPVTATPGSTFNYNSAAVHLLGVALEDATGRTLPALAGEILFGPLGIQEAVWEPTAGGRSNGGSGLDLLPIDMVKLGLLMLQDGLSGDTRLLPAGWAASAGSPAFGWRATYGALQSYTYGQLWWTADATTSYPSAYMAWGFGGQFIVVVPALDLVVVATTEWRGAGPILGQVETGVLDVIMNRVIGAIES